MPIISVVNAKEKCSKEGLKCYFSEHTSDKKMKEADGGYGEIFSGLNRRSNQPNIPFDTHREAKNLCD